MYNGNVLSGEEVCENAARHAETVGVCSLPPRREHELQNVG